MTDDLISRAEAQTALQFAAKRYTVAHEAHGEGQVVWSDNLINVTDAMNVLRDLPSAQPERKTGRWIPVTNGRGGHKCDRCGCYAPSYQSGTEWLSNFCPECGADMREQKLQYADEETAQSGLMSAT